MIIFQKWTLTILMLCCALTVPVIAQESFVLTSSAIMDGGDLPADLECTRKGGDGLSPPIEWTAVPKSTTSLAVIMHHYSRGKIEGVDAPSQYWLLWNIPADTASLPRGNPASIGDEGADKDERFTGYTPPCSPTGSRHEYTITLYALSSSPDQLPNADSKDVDWATMTHAIENIVIASTSFSFWN